jgi:hypothetical protein
MMARRKGLRPARDRSDQAKKCVTGRKEVGIMVFGPLVKVVSHGFVGLWETSIFCACRNPARMWISYCISNSVPTQNFRDKFAYPPDLEDAAARGMLAQANALMSY